MAAVGAGVNALAFLPSVDAPEMDDMSRLSRQRLKARRTQEGPRGSALIGEEIQLKELDARYRLVMAGREGEAAPSFGNAKGVRRCVIGTGAYGNVAKAVDGAGRAVAVKIVEDGAMAWENLRDEVHALRLSRKHPNVNELIEVLHCEETGAYYIVTEFCAGGELFDRLIEKGPYREAAAAMIVERIASALSHIHACGFAHMDIKPENLLFAAAETEAADEASDTCIRLIDFGMTKSLREFLNTGVTPITSSIGTTPYLSPELLSQMASATEQEPRRPNPAGTKLRMELHSDPRACDMWALGIITYILLLGCHPFDRTGDADDETIVRRARRGSLPDEESASGESCDEEEDEDYGVRFTFDVHKQLRLSATARDLITRLLDPDPATRLRSDEVLTHPWIRENGRAGPAVNARGTGAGQGAGQGAGGVKLSSLESFQSSSGSHRAIASALLVASLASRSKQVSPEDFLRAAFEVLGSREWCAVLSSTGSVSPADLRSACPDSQGLTFEDFCQVVHKCHTRSFEAGAPVFQTGDEAHGLYIITSGEAQIEYTGDGKQVAASLQPGDMFGETAILDGRDKRSATVRAVGPLETVFWSREDFVRTLGDTDALCAGLEEHIRLRQNKRARRLLEALGKPYLRKRRLKAGEMLFEQDADADALFLVETGCIGTFTRVVPDKPRGISALFGWLSAVAGAHDSASKPGCDGDDDGDGDGAAAGSRGGGASLRDMCTEDDRGARVPLREYRKGEVLGTTVVTGVARSSSAVCVEDAEVWCVSKTDLEKLIAREGSLHRNLLRLSRRDTEEQVARLRAVVQTGALPEGAHEHEWAGRDLSSLIQVIEKHLQRSIT